MSDQDRPTGGQGDQPLVGTATESQATPATGKVTKKKVVKKKTAKKKVAKKKVVKKTATRKKATAKKTATKKKVAKKKTSKKKVAKKVAANGGAAREVEKQAVSNAIRAAVSAGGDLMKPNGEEKAPLDAPNTRPVPVENMVPDEAAGHATDVESSLEKQGLGQISADEAAARQVEKRAVNDAILAAVNAGGSLMKPDTVDKPPVATSGQTAIRAASKSTTLTEPTEQAPPAAQTQVEEPTDISTSWPEQAQPPARHDPKPVPVAMPSQAAEPAGVELRVELEKSQTHVAKPKHQGVPMRILLIALCLAAAVLYAKILVPDFDYAGLMPEFAEETRTADEEPAGLRPLPESQMQIIRDVFAPELGQQ